MRVLLLLALLHLSAHASPSMPFTCDTIAPEKNARLNCVDYESEAGLALVPEAQEAKRSCLAYYTAAWETNLALCALRPTADTAANERTIQDLRAHFERNRKLAQDLQFKIGKLNSAGMRESSAEMGCTFSRNRTRPGAVPGMMLIGLAEKVFLELTINQPNLERTIRMAAKMVRNPQNSPAPGPAEIQRANGPIKLPGGPTDNEPDSSHSFWAVNSIAQYYAEKYGDDYAATWAKQLFLAHPEIARKMPALIKRLPKHVGTLAGAGLGVGLQYLVYGRVGALELISIGVTAYSFGAGLFVDLAIAAYRDKQEQRKEFADMLSELAQERPGISSAAVAKAWAERKKRSCDTGPDPYAHFEIEAKKKAPAFEGEGSEEGEE